MKTSGILFVIHLFLSAILLSFLTATEIYAVDQNFFIVPRISTTGQYEDNFFKSKFDEREVFTLLVQPGVEGGYETAMTNISFDYSLDAHFFKDRDDPPAGMENANKDDFIGHTVSLNAQTRPNDHWMFKFYESFHLTEDPAHSDEYSDPVNRESITVNRLSPSVLYRFGERLTAGLAYKNAIYQYERPDVEDGVEHDGILDLIYNLSETMYANVQYSHKMKDYSGSTSDYDLDKIMLFLGKQSYYFTLNVGLGYQDRTYDLEQYNIEAMNYHFSLAFQNPPDVETPQTFMSLTYKRGINEHSNMNNDYYIADEIKFKGAYALSERINLFTHAEFRYNDFETWEGYTKSGALENRKDHYYIGKIGIDFEINDWAKLTIAGGFENRDSNLDEKDYDTVSISTQLTFYYDIRNIE